MTFILNFLLLSSAAQIAAGQDENNARSIVERFATPPAGEPPVGWMITTDDPRDVPVLPGEVKDFDEIIRQHNIEHNQNILVSRKEVIDRTISFLFSGSTAEEQLENVGELLPQQAETVKRLVAEFKSDIKKIDSIPIKELKAEYERVRGRQPGGEEVERLLMYARGTRRQRLQQDLENELFDHQRLVIARWDPKIIGIQNTLTQTPIGDALGLTESQKEKLRERSHEIGSRFREAWFQAQRDAAELYDEVLTDEQAAQLKEIYAPNGRGDRPFVPQQPDEILHQMPYEYYLPDDLKARKKYGR